MGGDEVLGADLARHQVVLVVLHTREGDISGGAAECSIQPDGDVRQRCALDFGDSARVAQPDWEGGDLAMAFHFLRAEVHCERSLGPRPPQQGQRSGAQSSTWRRGQSNIPPKVRTLLDPGAPGGKAGARALSRAAASQLEEEDSRRRRRGCTRHRLSQTDCACPAGRCCLGCAALERGSEKACLARTPKRSSAEGSGSEAGEPAQTRLQGQGGVTTVAGAGAAARTAARGVRPRAIGKGRQRTARSARFARFPAGAASSSLGPGGYRHAAQADSRAYGKRCDSRGRRRGAPSRKLRGETG